MIILKAEDYTGEAIRYEKLILEINKEITAEEEALDSYITEYKGNLIIL